jgi:hypothetical protein
MPNRAGRAVIPTLLIAALVALLLFQGARPAAALPLPLFTVDPGYLYLNVPPGETAEATVRVTADPKSLIHLYLNAGWLTADTARFFGSNTVRISVSAKGLKVGDVRVGKIEFSDIDHEVNLPVVMAVGGGDTPPPVAASPSVVDFGIVSDAGGYQYLGLAFPLPAADATVRVDADWFEVKALYPHGGAYQMLSVYPIKTKLKPGHRYEGNIEISRSSQPVLKIPVTLQLAGAEPPAVPPGSGEQPGPFRDVPAGHWAGEAIAKLTAAGVIKGLGDERFGPDDPVTREQFAKLLVLALGLPQGTPPQTPPFPDVPADRWSAPYIAAARSYLSGYPDGDFHPENPALREEIAVALAQAKGLAQGLDDLWIFFDDANQISRIARPRIAAARAAGLINGFPDRTFRPAAPVTRAEVAVMLHRAKEICAQAGCGAPLGREDRELMGVSLYSLRDQAESSLGLPVAERPGYVNSYARSYRGGKVEVAYVTPDHIVWSVLVQGEGTTVRGVSIGDSVAAVRSAYGQAELKNGKLTYAAGADLDYFWISFTIVEGKVQAILLSQSK